MTIDSNNTNTLQSFEPYRAYDIAMYFAVKGIDTKRLSINVLYLPWLVYIAHGTYLATYGVPLIKDTIEAFKDGPFISGAFKEFSKLTINCNVYGFNRLDLNKKLIEDSKTINILNDVFKLSDLGYTELKKIVKDDVWYNTLHNPRNMLSYVMSNDDIKEYYTKLASTPEKVSDFKKISMFLRSLYDKVRAMF